MGARLWLVLLCLRFAGFWAKFFLQAPKGRPAPPRPARERQSQYALVQIGQKLGLDPCFEHDTVVATPASDRYPLIVLVPKLAVMAALAIPVTSPRRFPDLAAAATLARRFGNPRALAERWDGDAAFAELRVAGPNPAWLRREPSPDEAVQALSGDASDLFVVDYRPWLRGLPCAPGRFMAPCAAVFREHEGRLHTLGIVLEGPGGTQLARPDGTPGWQLAKMFFGNAEVLVHEAASHFLWTHVVGERLLLATRRHLDDAHPVSRLLAPHAHFTLQANENSGSRLLGPEGFFQRCFSAGWTGTVELLRRGQAAFRFEQLVLPRELASRGVNGLGHYPYRDDALATWNALSRYVAGALALDYHDDTHVATDVSLIHWTLAAGAPCPTTRDELATLTTAILFTTAQHSFVNALQFDAYAWPLVFPSTLRTPLPASLERVTERELVDALPSEQVVIDAARATYAFSVQYNVLGHDLERFLPPSHGPLVAQLRADLEAARRAAATRQGALPYDLLGRLSNSINA